MGNVSTIPKTEFNLATNISCLDLGESRLNDG